MSRRSDSGVFISLNLSGSPRRIGSAMTSVVVIAPALALLGLDVLNVESAQLIEPAVGPIGFRESVKVSHVIVKESDVSNLPVETGVDHIIRHSGSNPQHELTPFEKEVAKLVM